MARLARCLLAVAFIMNAATPSEAMEGLWTGQYVCSQGLTGATLNITRTPDASSWIIRFCFCAIPENPDLPTGECELSGAAKPDQAAVRVDPLRWISQPDGWVMAPMELQASPDGRTLTARIDSVSCPVTFHLTRIAGDDEKPRCVCPLPIVSRGPLHFSRWEGRPSNRAGAIR